MTAGRLALVLHSHMPYVEGFGTWPFGEEWLFEAMATSYLPLLDVLDDHPGRVTLSLTPVLCDQLEAPGVAERFRAFCGELRPASHALDVADARREGDVGLATVLEASALDYASALARFDALGGDLLRALGPHARWTSAATHAVLPLCATDAGVRLQLRVGVESHRARFGGWDGGLWLPECAYAPWLDERLQEAGVHAVCVDLTDVLGRGSAAQLRPIATAAGPRLVPIDRVILELVWSETGYPSAAAYRDYHRRSARDHHPWAVGGGLYDAGAATERVREDAADFVARVAARVAGGGLCVCALDTELLGHWWYEGPAFLRAVLQEAERVNLDVVSLDTALTEIDATGPLAAEVLGTTTWGTPRTLRTWDHPGVAALAWQSREAELRVVAAGPHPPARAVRELLALQSSDWAFLATRGTAGPYPVERATAHRAALAAALAGDPSGPALRHLAPHADPEALSLA